ncbi:MAG: hypothetical protein QM691_05635 [Opitutaceae bacterium]
MLEPCRANPALDNCIAMLAAYRRLVRRDGDYLQSLAGCCRGETLFCLGNGPSLARQDPELLAGTNVISTNQGYRFLRNSKTLRTWHLVTDTTRFREVGPELGDGCHPAFCAPYRLSAEWLELAGRWPNFRVLPTTQFVQWTGETWELAARDTPLCAFRLPHELEHCGFSVIFAAIQLAVYLGARRVVLLGVDMDYSGGHSHFVPGVSHLNPSYEYETHARSALVHFRKTLAAMGCELLNATDGGRVDVLERISFADVALEAARVSREKRIQEANADELTAWRARGLVTQVPVGRPVVLWGSNSLAKRVQSLLAQRRIPVQSIVDRRGEGCERPAELFARLHQHPKNGGPVIVICSRNSRDEIRAELAQEGISGPEDVVELPDLRADEGQRT